MATPTQQDDAVQLFLQHFGLKSESPPKELLLSVVGAFARLPYENLSKIIEDETSGTATPLPTALQILRDHVRWGTGGTCFSLTAALMHLLRELGWTVHPILADRPYGPNTHCALLVELDQRPHVIDPGFLLTRPIPAEANREQRVCAPFQEIMLVPRGSNRLELRTVQHGKVTPRLTYKTDPVEESVFHQLWHKSYDWEMMRSLVVTAVHADKHLYLQGNRLQTRSPTLVERRELPPEELALLIQREFGIASEITNQALRILRRRGESVERLP